MSCAARTSRFRLASTSCAASRRVWSTRATPIRRTGLFYCPDPNRPCDCKLTLFVCSIIYVMVVDRCNSDFNRKDVVVATLAPTPSQRDWWTAMSRAPVDNRAPSSPPAESSANIVFAPTPPPAVVVGRRGEIALLDCGGGRSGRLCGVRADPLLRLRGGASAQGRQRVALGLLRTRVACFRHCDDRRH